MVGGFSKCTSEPQGCAQVAPAPKPTRHRLVWGWPTSDLGASYFVLLQELNDYRALLLNHPEQYRLQEKLEEEGWQGLSRTEQQTLRLPSVIV